MNSEEEKVTARHGSVEPGDAMSVDITFPADDWDLVRPRPASTSEAESAGENEPWYHNLDSMLPFVIILLIVLAIARGNRGGGRSAGGGASAVAVVGEEAEEPVMAGARP